MRSIFVLIPLTLLVSGCATSAAKAPSCSGPRRPANPYGSVLAPTGAPPTPASSSPSPSSAMPCLGSVR